MAKELVIVESPAKARTLERYLGKDYVVMASRGHVRDLPQYRFGVDVEKDFEPKYEVPKEKKDVVKKLAEAAKKASTVYLATDPDREGEAISWHLVQASKITNTPIKRVVFHEITENAIKSAFKKPREIDIDLVNAQQARRVLDRVVGYRLSPLLWRKIEKGLSAGRVQSVALRIIADREADIQAFVPTEYWSIEADLKKQGKGTHPKFKATLHSRKGVKGKLSIADQQSAEEIVQHLEGASYTAAKVDKKKQQRKPSAPFTTSTLQQEAWRKLRFTAKRTMTIAQQLYEGLSLGPEGQVGLITYMRTDSTSVSNEARNQVRAYIDEKYGSQYLPPSPRSYTKKTKGAQEAHEAIRPTSADRDPSVIADYLSSEQRRLYELIWKRMVASQMSNAAVEATSVNIEAVGSKAAPPSVNGKVKDKKSDKPYVFRASGSVITFPGFLVLYQEDQDEQKAEDGQSNLPELTVGEGLNCAKLSPLQHFTQPPPRYTDASLVKALEEYGIGRPSTYAPTLSTIQDRRYVDKQKGRFQPTDLGITVNGLLKEHFPNIVDLGFTAEMEEELDEIARGERSWPPVIREFYEPFQESIKKAAEAIPDEAEGMDCDVCGKPMVVKAGRRGRFIACTGYPECKNTKPIPGSEEDAEEEKIDETCDKCGSPMAIKTGRLGKFIACTGYPKCKNTKPVPGSEEDAEEEEINETCDKCGSPMAIKMGRLGKFIACTGYPKCKNTKPYLIKTGASCPECGGDIVEKVNKKGRTFYSCATYPACSYAVSQRPLTTGCPECDGLLVVSGRDGARCTKCKSKYKIADLPAEQEEEEVKVEVPVG